MKLKNNKWKRVVTIYSIGFGLIVLFELIPRYQQVGSDLYDTMTNKNGSRDPEIVNDDYNKAQSENKKLKSEIYNYITKYESKNSASSLVEILNSLAGDCRVNIVSIKPFELKTKNSIYFMPLEVNVSGKYEGIYNFLNMVENSSKIIIIKSGSLKQSEVAGILSFKINMEVYLNI